MVYNKEGLYCGKTNIPAVEHGWLRSINYPLLFFLCLFVRGLWDAGLLSLLMGIYVILLKSKTTSHFAIEINWNSSEMGWSSPVRASHRCATRSLNVAPHMGDMDQGGMYPVMISMGFNLRIFYGISKFKNQHYYCWGVSKKLSTSMY